VKFQMLHLYVDGSCLGNQNVDADTPAGWGFVVVSGDNSLGKGNGKIIHEEFGVVETSGEESLGAKVGSNNTAELTAIAQALRWLLKEGDNSDVIIRGDSQYAGNIATSKWKAKANRELAKTVQGLWNEISSIRVISWKHVKAHSGHRWNERADHLALRAAERKAPEGLSFWKPGQR